MQGPDLIGWAASLVLIATLVRQTIAQWRADEPQGVSGWLFAGQIAASVLFIVYSVLLKNMVFIVTNSLILLTALVGQWVYWRAKRNAGGDSNHSGRD
jgi:MtN3 and saliva related transmembrane protein